MLIKKRVWMLNWISKRNYKWSIFKFSPPSPQAVIWVWQGFRSCKPWRRCMKLLLHHPKKSQKINPVASKMAIRPWRVAPEEKKSAILRFDMFPICFRLKTRLTTPIFPKNLEGVPGNFFFGFYVKMDIFNFYFKAELGTFKIILLRFKRLFLNVPKSRLRVLRTTAHQCAPFTTRLKSGSARIDLLCMGPVGYLPTTTDYPYSS